ncbi:FAD-dependent oxidoreductase [Acinetobacter baumannii]
MHNTIVIIGGGHAGFQLANTLRRDGYKGSIFIFEKQNDFPYQRPPLSKDYLLGSMEENRVFFRPPEFYHSNAIEIVFSEVTRIDRKNKKVICKDDKSVFYDSLIFAVGVTPNKLDFCELNYKNVYTISDLQNAKNLKKALDMAQNIVIVGTGFIGLEMAGLVKKLDKEVHVISSGNQVLRKSVSKKLSSFIKEQHISNGVKFYDCERIADWVVKDHNITSVTLSSKISIPADLVVVGIGSKPNVYLAESIGLEVDSGILVDDSLCTSDPSIYAIGDCAQFPYLNHSIRLESVQNTMDQARYLSQKLLKDIPGSYSALPWFWSDQWDMKIQIAGVKLDNNRELDTITVDSDLSSGCTCLSFLNDILVIVETVNRPAIHMISRKILSSENIPAKSDLEKYKFDLNRWLISTSGKIKTL